MKRRVLLIVVIAGAVLAGGAGAFLGYWLATRSSGEKIEVRVVQVPDVGGPVAQVDTSKGSQGPAQAAAGGEARVVTQGGETLRVIQTRTGTTVVVSQTGDTQAITASQPQADTLGPKGPKGLDLGVSVEPQIDLSTSLAGPQITIQPGQGPSVPNLPGTGPQISINPGQGPTAGSQSTTPSQTSSKPKGQTSKPLSKEKQLKQAYYQRHDLAATISLAKEILASDPGNSYARKMLKIAKLEKKALQYERQGNRAKARATWQQILRLDPGNKWAKEGIRRNS